MNQELNWNEAVGRLRSRVSPQNYDMWLRPIELMSWDGVILRLRAPNSYVRLWFESNFLGSLLDEIRGLGHDDIHVEFEPDGGERPPPMSIQADPDLVARVPRTVPASSSAQMQAVHAPAPDELPVPESATLNPRYTFDTFVA